MIIHINDFDRCIGKIHENSTIGSGDSKTVNAQVLRLEQFCVEGRMKWITTKKRLLFLESAIHLMLFNKNGKTFFFPVWAPA